MKKLICLMGGAMLVLSAQAQWGRQNIDHRLLDEPFYTSSWIKQDVPLGKVLNYKDSVITLNDFKDKLIILAFWFTQCTDCIAQFPREDSLQREFGNEIQFVLVTFNPAAKVKKFLDDYKSRTGIAITVPVIVEDTLLSKAFRHLYNPHYAWIFPDGKIVAQSTEHFVTAGNIRSLLNEWQKRKAFFQQVTDQKKQAAASGK